MRRIPCACVACTNILDRPLASGVAQYQQPLYQPVVDSTYLTVPSSFNIWNIIKFTNKTKLPEDFGDIHKVVLDATSKKMASLAQKGKYGTINASYTTTMGY